jgi:hypothetical protein
MQTAALLQKPMHLGEGFDGLGGLEDWWSSGGDTVDTIFTANQPYDFNYDSQDPSQGGSFTFSTGGMDAAVVDTLGNVNTQSGQPLITANTLSLIATNNPGREAQAVAQSLQVTNPDWTKQFKNTDELVRAAAGLFSTVKAVVTGQPIPRNTQSPYVYGPGQAPMQQTGLTTTHMLLIGGAALAAILLLRRK